MVKEYINRGRRLCFFFNDAATTEIYPLSLHDALPISDLAPEDRVGQVVHGRGLGVDEDRKSTRLNSSHDSISYAVFCLKKKQLRQPLDSSDDGAVLALTSAIELYN